MTVPRRVGRCLIPRGLHADQPRESSVLPPPEHDQSCRAPKGAPPSRLSKSQCRCAATLRFDPPSGPLSPATDGTLPPESAFRWQPGIFWVRVSPGASPPT